jgi:hypothetical protein
MVYHKTFSISISKFVKKIVFFFLAKCVVIVSMLFKLIFHLQKHYLYNASNYQNVIKNLIQIQEFRSVIPFHYRHNHVKVKSDVDGVS